MKTSLNVWAHNPDVEYVDPIHGQPLFLPLVEGLDHSWTEQDFDYTLQQSIDAAFDCGRLDVVKQLAKHL